jgi:lipoyl(octanoyl) transferase
LGLRGDRRAHSPGVWVGGYKIAAIGIGVSRWFSSHGFALNVSDANGPDGLLRAYDRIVPCGLSDVKIGALSQFAGANGNATGTAAAIDAEALRRGLCRHFASVFNVDCRYRAIERPIAGWTEQADWWPAATAGTSQRSN